MEMAGKISEEDAYQEIKSLCKELKQIRKSYRKNHES